MAAAHHQPRRLPEGSNQRSGAWPAGPFEVVSNSHSTIAGSSASLDMQAMRQLESLSSFRPNHRHSTKYEGSALVSSSARREFSRSTMSGKALPFETPPKSISGREFGCCARANSRTAGADGGVHGVATPASSASLHWATKTRDGVGRAGHAPRKLSRRTASFRSADTDAISCLTHDRTVAPSLL